MLISLNVGFAHQLAYTNDAAFILITILAANGICERLVFYADYIFRHL